MGTRGVVAIGCATQWSGIPNHMDSYPTCLGRKVWKVLSDTLAEDHSLERFVTQVRRFADFDQVLNGGVCQYCGQLTGQPHSISPAIAAVPSELLALPTTTFAEYTEAYRALFPDRAVSDNTIRVSWCVAQTIASTGYPDPEVKYHQHDPIDASQSNIRLADALKSNGFLFYEWVYVVQVETNSLHVLESVRTPLTFIDEIHNDQGAYVLEQPLYAPILVTTLSLDEPEPDWEELENMANALQQQWEQEYAQNPNHPDLVMLRMTVPNVKKANRTALRP